MLPAIFDAVLGALSSRASSLDEAQAVYGIDAESEAQIQHRAALGIMDAGLGVVREAYYPGGVSSGASDSGRKRCDLCVTPAPDRELIDPLREARERARADETLFGAALRHREPGPDGYAPEDAWWIEVKIVAQHACRDGVFTPNSGYASALIGWLARDVEKLALDDRIWHGAVLMIVFTSDERTFTNDLHAAVSAVVGRGLPVLTPLSDSCAITDRAGNACMGVALVPVAT